MKQNKYTVTNIFIASAWFYFAWGFFLSFQTSHKPSTLVFLIAESLTAILFLVRDDPVLVSKSSRDWLCGFLGTFLPLLFRPSSGMFMAGEIILIVGVAFQIASLLSLDRSFGIVPANRGVKTNGAYRFVRHPMYLSSIIFSTGYVLANISLWNGAFFLFIVSAQILRIFNEEEFFSQREEYESYKEKVRWRLVPLVF